jgi:single-stranded DNA-binding protein
VIHCLVAGVLVKDATTGTSQKGTSWARALVRSGEGETAVLVSVVAFGEECEQLATLIKGDGISASGRFEVGTYQKNGIDVPSYSVIGARILTARPPKRSKVKAERHENPFADLEGHDDLDEAFAR